jgi:hypothetical protein
MTNNNHYIPLTRVCSLVSIKDYLLLTFKDSRGYQLRFVNSQGEVFGEQLTFDSSDEAESAGWLWVMAMRK